MNTVGVRGWKSGKGAVISQFPPHPALQQGSFLASQAVWENQGGGGSWGCGMMEKRSTLLAKHFTSATPSEWAPMQDTTQLPPN